jgi:hypothetical protein
MVISRIRRGLKDRWWHGRREAVLACIENYTKLVPGLGKATVRKLRK